VARKPPSYVKQVRLILSLDCLKNEYLQLIFIIEEGNIKSKDWTSIVSCHCKKPQCIILSRNTLSCKD